MKLVLAIVDREDVTELMKALAEEKIRVTKFATTGGFLKSGNATLISGVEDYEINKVINIISKISRKKENVASELNARHGRATIFVLNIEQFEKF
ncbi:MAG: cyclic-di-AMP receptor [Candidatus Paraimprobicoccus trichonymphae]|uniref:Cyclic-di-AMP receptor n=1 Tax=Candidatus Paraimprobicoccus trichonymphae TaxID=3033793 RepID=A0AA48HW55_9FIRM|nr:MAG: cyclic-di-AMP receptor [Candidatus Paraimprobicoccus trichonymphae]